MLSDRYWGKGCRSLQGLRRECIDVVFTLSERRTHHKVLSIGRHNLTSTLKGSCLLLLRIDGRESKVEAEGSLKATTITHVRDECGMDQVLQGEI